MILTHEIAVIGNKGLTINAAGISQGSLKYSLSRRSYIAKTNRRREKGIAKDTVYIKEANRIPENKGSLKI